VTVYVTPPVPDPPVVVNWVTVVPGGSVSAVFDTDSVAWATGAVNVNVVAALVAAR
jgi:hypothetical protein